MGVGNQVYHCVGCGGYYTDPHECHAPSPFRLGFGTSHLIQPPALTEARVREIVRECMPQLRVVHRTVLNYSKKNEGSKRYPNWVDHVEQEKVEILQYLRNGTWLDVPIEYETVEYHDEYNN